MTGYQRVSKSFLGIGMAGLLGLGAMAATFSGCNKEDCAKSAKMGDFEYSQGNYVNAIKHYEKALRINEKCGVVGEKLVEAKRRAAAGN